MSSLPPCQTTLIGSMPHASATGALADLAQYMAVFYEHVITENLDALAISPDYASGLHAFLQ